MKLKLSQIGQGKYILSICILELPTYYLGKFLKFKSQEAKLKPIIEEVINCGNNYVIYSTDIYGNAYCVLSIVLGARHIAVK